MDNKNKCKHEFVSYSQCCYCGSFDNGKEVIEKRVQSNVEDFRQSFIKWYSGVKETNGDTPPLAIQIFFWFEKNIGISNPHTKDKNSERPAQK